MRRPLMSATQLAVEEIRDLIESGQLQPGARVNADELAESLGVSRTPVRDALQQLKTEGIVDILPRKGVFVRTISKAEVKDVYAIKTAIEPLAATWAAERGSDEDNQRLLDLIDELEKHAATPNVASCARVVDEIHSRLFTMAASDVLSEVYRVFHGRVKLLRHLNMSQPGRLEVSVRQHGDIVRHVVNHEPVEAGNAMQQHMLDAALSVESVVS